MLDLFQRLTAKEGTYFLPHDLELSNQELSYIVKKAEQWRGSNGERRKVRLEPSEEGGMVVVRRVLVLVMTGHNLTSLTQILSVRQDIA